MDLDLAGKTAIVTGASRGIGRGIAEALAAEGANVVICARGEDALAETARAIAADRALAIAADITNPADIERIVAAAVDRFGGIDVLVCNAGGSRHPKAVEATDEDWQDGFERNPLQVARLVRAAFPQLRLTRGRVLIIASIYGREAGGSPIYNAMKAAEISLATMLARELAPDGIAVNALCPGSTAFPGGSWQRRIDADPAAMAAFVASDIPLGRFGTVPEIAAVAAFLCSPKASWVTGVAIPVDGGQSRSIL